MCPCCGHRALGDAGPYLCGVCTWDDHHHAGGWIGAPRVGLLEAQRTFARIGVADPARASRARPPRATEARPVWWLSLDAAPEALAIELERAFATVELDDAIANRREGPWQLLTRPDLERFTDGASPFTDAGRLRYYVPAYFVLGLRASTLVPGTEALLQALADGPHLHALLRLMTLAERRAVARVLAFLVAREDADSLDAQRALGGPFGADLEAAQLELTLAVAPLN